MPTLRRKSPYTGILAEPMPKHTVLTGPTDEELSALIDQKMRALLVHYEIDPSDAFGPGPKMAAAWAQLAWRLAREHVPGFGAEPRRRGKPPTRKFDDTDLVLHVELRKRRDALSDRKAIKVIVGQNLISGTEQALLQRYKRAKKQFAPISRMLDNFAAAEGHNILVKIMEKSLSGDNKDSFLSPG